MVGCVLVLVGCAEALGRERVTDTDRHRVQVMLDEPILRSAGEDLTSQPGTLLTADTWTRGSVSASIFSMYPDDGRTRPAPKVIARRTAEAVGVLRESGWTITSALCDVPKREEPSGSAQPSPEPASASTSSYWSWKVTAYKHVDGVSYWALLTAAAVDSGVGLIDINMRAPNVDDPPDLFADRPPGLPAGSTCIEKPGLVSADVRQGNPVELAPAGPPALVGTEPGR